MIDFEQHWRDLGPVDWDRPMSMCSEPELKAIEELAAAYADGSRYRAIRAVAETLYLQVQHERARRVADQGRIDCQFWTLAETARLPVEEPDLSGIPPWSQVSTPEEGRP